MVTRYKLETLAVRSDGSSQRERITFHDKNKAGEEIVIDMSRCDLSGSIGKSWKKQGNIDKNMKDWIGVDVYSKENNGTWRGKYNPTVKKDGEKPVGYQINFDWVLPWTDENRQKIITEVIKRAKF